MEASVAVGRLGVAVDAPEHERGVAEVEVGQALEQGLVERVALEAGLERAAEVGLGEVAQAPRRRLGALEALVGVIDVGLLVGQFRVLLRHSSVVRPSSVRGGNPPKRGRVTLSGGRAQVAAPPRSFGG